MGEWYRLHEALGGGEYEEHRRPDGSTEAPIGTVAFLVDGFLVCVALGLLTKVEPPLPPEPPDGAVVLDRAGTVWLHGVRDDRAHDCVDWFSTDDTNASWATLNHPDYAPLTRLVPDPAAGVELPWGTQPRVWVDESPGRPAMVGVRYKTDFWLKPQYAREMAAALLAAADAAEVSS